MTRRKWLDPLLLALLTVILVWPFFRVEYFENWPSIESTFISDARMLRDHLPHPGWQPLWYGGTRFDYIYPPALRYGTALISLAAGISTARAYHLYVGTFYVLGILAVWWLVYVGSRSRWPALLAGLATAMVSPVAYLVETVRHDNGYWWPQRLHVLQRYGEGPHITALGILPAALAASLLALRQKSGRWLAAAALLCALVVSNNFYGAAALVIFFPVVVWAVFITEKKTNVLLRAGAIALLAWGGCAFWLTPSYVRITLANLHTVAEPGNLPSTLAGLAVALLFGFGSWFFAWGRPERMWAVLVSGLAILVGFNVLGYYYAHLVIAGDTRRLVPELDLALTLATITAAAGMWRHRRLRIGACLAMVVLFAPTPVYLKHRRGWFQASANPEDSHVRRVAKWAEMNLAGQRVLPSGMVRFWWDAWGDNSQIEGGSQQGRLNQELPVASWQILVGESGELARLWLQALGTSAVVVPSPGSREFYLDYKFPDKFRGVLPVLWDDGHNTVIYGVPRVHPGIARVVDTTAMQAMPVLWRGDDADALHQYLSQVERADQPQVRVEWRGLDEVRLNTTVSRGQEVLLQETFDPAWHAYEKGREMPVRLDRAMNFMRIETGEGQHEIQMRFETPLENRVGQGMFVLAALVCIGLLRRG